MLKILIYILLIPFIPIIFIFELLKEIFRPSTPKKACKTGHDYEYFVAQYLRDRGFRRVSVTKASGDYGVDVTAYKNGKKYAVQCKYYTGNVGVSAVQEVVAGKSLYNCDVAMVVTNSEFTAAAKTLAKSNGVILRPGVRP